VTLVVRTNRELFSGRLELDTGKELQEVRGEVLADDARAFRVKFTMEKSGQFRLHFTTKTGDENSDKSAYDLIVIPDMAPSVELTKPDRDVELPANGTLELEGYAKDDYGIKRLTLRLEIARGPKSVVLKEKEYRPDKDFKFADGSYPDRVHYKDFLPWTSS